MLVRAPNVMQIGALRTERATHGDSTSMLPRCTCRPDVVVLCEGKFDEPDEVFMLPVDSCQNDAEEAFPARSTAIPLFSAAWLFWLFSGSCIFILFRRIWPFSSGRIFICFRPFWPFLGGCLPILFSRASHFRVAALLLFSAFLAIFRRLHFHCFPPFWPVLGGCIFSVFGRLGHFRVASFLLRGVISAVLAFSAFASRKATTQTLLKPRQTRITHMAASQVTQKERIIAHTFSGQRPFGGGPTTHHHHPPWQAEK